MSEFLRDWVLATVRGALGRTAAGSKSQRSQPPERVSVLGSLLRQFGKLERAAEVYESGRQLRVATGTLETADGAELLGHWSGQQACRVI